MASNRKVIVIFLALTLFACSREKQLEPIREVLLTSERLPAGAKSAYGEMKGISKKSDRALEQSYSLFAHQTALVDYLLTHDYAGDVGANLRVLEARNQALLKLHFDRLASEGVTDKSIAQYYDSHFDQFTKPKLKVMTLKFRVTPHMSDEQRAERREQAELLHQDLVAGHTTFEQAYGAYNNGNAPVETELTQIGGDTASLLELSPGDVSSVIETDDAFVIYKLTAKEQETQSLESARDEIGYHLKQKAQLEEEERLARLIQSL